MKNFFLLFIVIIICSSCEVESPCGIASTGPPLFTVEIIDAATNENVFTNGTYTEQQLKVTTPYSTYFDYFFISENNFNVINIFPGATDGTYTTYIKVGDQITIPIESKVYKSSSRCYTNYFMENIEVKGFDYTLDKEKGIYKIKI